MIAQRAQSPGFPADWNNDKYFVGFGSGRRFTVDK
jgi:hypothetical protein